MKRLSRPAEKTATPREPSRENSVSNQPASRSRSAFSAARSSCESVFRRSSNWCSACESTARVRADRSPAVGTSRGSSPR